MTQRLPPSSGSAPGFGGQLVAAVLGLVVVLSFITLGFVVFFVLMVVGTVFWLVFLVRRWWLTRGSPEAAAGPVRDNSGDTLDGEFRVIDKDQSGGDTNADSDERGR